MTNLIDGLMEVLLLLLRKGSAVEASMPTSLLRIMNSLSLTLMTPQFSVNDDISNFIICVRNANTFREGLLCPALAALNFNECADIFVLLYVAELMAYLSKNMKNIHHYFCDRFDFLIKSKEKTKQQKTTKPYLNSSKFRV